MIADNDGTTRLSLALPHRLTFLIFFHDPDFFEINYKPTFPSILKTVNPEGDFNHVYNLGMTEVRQIKMFLSWKKAHRIVGIEDTYQYWHHSFNHVTT